MQEPDCAKLLSSKNENFKMDPKSDREPVKKFKFSGNVRPPV